MNSKRWLAALLCVVMLLAFTACRDGKDPQSQPSTESQGDHSANNESPNAGVFEEDDSSSEGAKPTDNEFDAGNWFDDDTTTTTADGSTTSNTKNESATEGVASTTTTSSAGHSTGESAASSSAQSSATASGATSATSTAATPSQNEFNGGDWFEDDATTVTTTTATTVASAEQTKVGKVSLPATGYDPDGKGRIQIGAVSYDKPMVTIEVKNVTTKWMTEETDYLEYTCYDKKGNKLTSKDAIFGKLYIGALRAGKSVTKTFSVPNGTVRVEITGYKLTYWTEWA